MLLKRSPVLRLYAFPPSTKHLFIKVDDDVAVSRLGYLPIAPQRRPYALVKVSHQRYNGSDLHTERGVRAVLYAVSWRRRLALRRRKGFYCHLLLLRLRHCWLRCRRGVVVFLVLAVALPTDSYLRLCWRWLVRFRRRRCWCTTAFARHNCRRHRH